MSIHRRVQSISPKSIDVTEMFFPVAVLGPTYLPSSVRIIYAVVDCACALLMKTEVEAGWKWKLARSGSYGSGSWMEVEVGWKWKHEGKSQWMAPTSHHKYLMRSTNRDKQSKDCVPLVTACRVLYAPLLLNPCLFKLCFSVLIEMTIPNTVTRISRERYRSTLKRTYIYIYIYLRARRKGSFSRDRKV